MLTTIEIAAAVTALIMTGALCRSMAIERRCIEKAEDERWEQLKAKIETDEAYK